MINKNSNKISSDNQNEKGKIISDHLALVNMDAWYYIYENYVNPKVKSTEKK